MRQLPAICVLLTASACNADAPTTTTSFLPAESTNTVDVNIYGNGWHADSVWAVFYPSAPVMAVSANSSTDPRVKHIALTLQNVRYPGTFAITGSRASISVTTTNDSTWSTGGNGDSGPASDCCGLTSYGTMTIWILTTHRIAGQFSTSVHGTTASGSFDVAIP